MNYPELQYTIEGLEYDVVFTTNIFDDDMKNDIINVVNSLSKSIYIDKSYVSTKSNKYENVFLTEDGWISFTQMMFMTTFTKKLKNKEKRLVVNTFLQMAECYLYSSLISYFDFEYINIVDHIELVPKDSVEFSVVISKDNAMEWSTIQNAD